ncbi:MAG: hypothetical protein M3R71_02230 [Actinomycetota bacterium]|nr:hypothetical protein [Actinomycetota bacterium]
MAAALAEHAGLSAASAGFMGEGQPAPPLAVEVMAERGIDISGHRSRQVTAELVADAELVLTMTRQHLIDVVMLNPQRWAHCFTLIDAVGRAENLGPRPPATDLTTWVGRMGGGRSRSSLLGLALDDDIPDPMGRRRSAFVDTAKLLNDLVLRLGAMIWPA